MAGILKVSIQGTLPNGEVWSVNPVWALPTGDFALTYTELTTIVTAINARTVPVDLRAAFNVATLLTGARVEHRTLGGTLYNQVEQLRPAPVAGGGTERHPMQTSAVISLRTAASGGTGRGRLYWPATGFAMDASTLRFASAQVPAFMAAAKTYLSGITTDISATSAGAKLSVWSRTTSSANDVNRLLVGDVPDVQRRRRDAQTETYSNVAFP